MNNKVEITSGDDVALSNPLILDDEPFPVPANATVICRIVSKDRNMAYTAAVEQDSGADGADWPNGIVGVAIPADKSSQMSVAFANRKGERAAILETVIDSTSGKRTFWADLTILKGSA